MIVERWSLAFLSRSLASSMTGTLALVNERSDLEVNRIFYFGLAYFGRFALKQEGQSLEIKVNELVLW